MIKKIKRREVLTKVAIAAGGLLAFKSGAAELGLLRAQPFAGSWLYQGQPCAIFQQGVVLLVVNEQGSLATAQVTGPNTFVIMGGAGWDSGLTAKMVMNRGLKINWSNNTVWSLA
jgi:hypothetical protein